MLLTVKEVCASLSISKSTLYRWINQGVFPAPIKVFNTARWKAECIDKFLGEHDGSRLQERVPSVSQ